MIKGTNIGAWVTSHHTNVKDLVERITSSDPEVASRAIGSLGFTHSEHDMSEHGWARIGTVEIRFTDVVDGDTLIANQIAALRAEIARERADFLRKERELEHRISELQALPAPESIDG